MIYVTLEGSAYVKYCTKLSNTPTTADAPPTYRIYGTGNTTVLTGTMGSGIIDSQTGLYAATIACTALNGFAAGQSYIMIITYAIAAATKSDTLYITVR